jgi:phage shock protein E
MMNPIVRIVLALATLAAIAGCAGAPASAPASALASALAPSADYRDPAALRALIAARAEPYLLLDVRTAQEYSSGHIPTAVNAPVDSLAAHPPAIGASSLIIVYCASGRRSALAKETLDGLGFTRVVDFGGVGRWDGELVKGATP